MVRRFPSRCRSHGPSGFVLLAVLVVVAAAILVATGGIFAARATTMNARAAAGEQQLRDAALDGVALVADGIAHQRRDLLRGGSPVLDRMVFARGEGIARIEVTLEALAGGELFESESAKLDFNRLDDAAIDAAMRDASDDTIALVEAMKSARPLSSIDGSAALLPEGARARTLAPLLGTLRSSGGDEGAPRSEESMPALVTLFTVHARESLVDNEGGPRLDLLSVFGDREDDADRATATLRAFDDAEVEALEQAAVNVSESPDDSVIAQELRKRGVTDQRIDELLRACTLHEGTLAPSRLDITRANERALAAWGGLDADAAGRILDLRDTLDAEERQGIAWLVTRRVLDAETFASVAGRFTHRSTSWRYRVSARLVDTETQTDAPTTWSEASANSDAARGPMALFDVIVDVSGETPRLVYLRDMTLIESARALAVLAAETDAARQRDRSTQGDDDADGTTPAPVSQSDDATFPAPTTMDFVPDIAPATLPTPSTSPAFPTSPTEIKPMRSRSNPTGRDVRGGS